MVGVSDLDIGMGNSFTLGEIVERFGGELLGDASIRVSQVAALETAQAHHLSFFTATRLQKQLDATARRCSYCRR